MTPPEIIKFPRTPHLQGSRLQPGDEDLAQVPFASLRGARLVVSEKVDGANAAVRFGRDGALLLQSRGHYLTGGARERHFDLMKTWASAHQHALREVLGDRYVMYGEWLYAKHTIFYDALPHYFMEFDVFDTEREEFLSTARRRVMLRALPVTSAPACYEGLARTITHLRGLIGPSAMRTSAWRERLDDAARAQGVDPARARRETDPHDEMEGVYIKVEDDRRVVARYKFVRFSFSNAILDSGSHWRDRPIIANVLADGVDLFAQSVKP